MVVEGKFQTVAVNELMKKFIAQVLFRRYPVKPSFLRFAVEHIILTASCSWQYITSMYFAHLRKLGNFVFF